MKIIFHLASAFVLQVFMGAAMSSISMAQDVILTPQETTNQRICALDPVQNLLPPVVRQDNNSLLAYLAQEGFIQNEEGAWVCYVNDPQQRDRFYTLFKVQVQDGKVIASSFLENGQLIEGQENRMIDLFMTVVGNHMNTNQQNSESIRRYLETFVSLVQQNKIQASNRAFLFDQPNRALVVYHNLSQGTLQGTAITINIQSPSNLTADSVTSQIQPNLSLRETLKLSR
jgi:hypothetical protein